MKHLRGILLLAPLLLIAATCVTDVRQRGPAGPWVGEVTNYGPEATGYTYVDGTISDAQRRVLGNWQTLGCPVITLPGETTAFEIAIEEGILDEPWLGFEPVLPLRLDSLRAGGFLVTDQEMQYGVQRGLLTQRIISNNAEHDYAVIELRNDSPFDVQLSNLCAVHRNSTGAVVSVATTSVVNSLVRRGDSLTLPVFFSTLGSWEIDVFAEGVRYQGCCSVSVPTSAVSVSMMKVVDRADGRYLYVTGTVRNERDDDITSLEMSAHLDDRWEERIDRAFIGCEGQLGRDAITPFMIEIPVASADTDRTLVVEALAASAGQLYEFPVTGVALGSVMPQVDGFPETRSVSATLTNDSNVWIEAYGACVALKDSAGRIVGAGYMNPDYPNRFVAPGTSVRVTTEVTQLAPATAADVIAYGIPTSGPPPTPIADPIVPPD